LYGVSAGSPSIYVGGGTHYSGASAPTMLADGYCFFPWGGKEFRLNNCMYLVDEPGKFEWVRSSFGVTEMGAVMYKGLGHNVPVGRVRHDGLFKVGKISIGSQCMFYPHNGKEYNAKYYEALVYKPNRLRQNRNC
jgi:Protein of unknown function (DUF3421)